MVAQTQRGNSDGADTNSGGANTKGKLSNIHAVYAQRHIQVWQGAATRAAHSGMTRLSNSNGGTYPNAMGWSIKQERCAGARRERCKRDAQEYGSIKQERCEGARRKHQACPQQRGNRIKHEDGQQGKRVWGLGFGVWGLGIKQEEALQGKRHR